MNEETLLPSFISVHKQAMYPIMREFYDVENPSRDVAKRFVKSLREYLEYIDDSPYTPAPGMHDVSDRHRFLPVVIQEVQWANKEYARIQKEYSLGPFS